MQKKIKQLINVRLIIFILASLVIALYTIIMLFGYSDIDQSGRTSENKNDTGYYIFYNLLKRLGYKIQKWDLYSGFRRDAVLFYFHYRKNQERDFKTIKNWIADGNIIFLIGMDTNKDPFFDNKLILGEMQTVDLHLSLKEGIDTFSFKSNFYFDKESSGEILLGNDQGSILLKDEYDDGIVYLLSDTSLLSNRILADENIAIFLNNLVKKYYGNAIFIHEPEAFRTVHPIHLLFKGKLFTITVHLLLMGMIFMLCYSIRFGNPVYSHPLARRTLQEHLDAVGFFYQKANALNLADKYGLKYFLYQVKNILRIKKNISKKELVILLKKEYLPGYTENELTLLLSETREKSEKTLIKKRQKRNEIIAELKTLKKQVR